LELVENSLSRMSSRVTRGTVAREALLI